MLLTGGADRPTAEARGGMRLEAGFVRLPMHELLGAAHAADQKEAEQLLVAVVRPGRVVGLVHGAYLNGWRNADARPRC